MPLLSITETTPLLPSTNNTKMWRQTVNNWITGIYQESKYLVLTSFWISSAIITIAALNVISTEVNSNNDIDFKKTFATLIKWEVISNAAASLFISFLKKCLTNLGSKQLAKTSFYQAWNKFKNKVFAVPMSTPKLNFEEIKTKINIINTNKTILTIQMKEFLRIYQQLITTFETFIRNNIEDDTTLNIETENINKLQKTSAIILINELIKIISTTTAFISGVAFASAISITKNNISNDLPLDFISFAKTFTARDNIIVSFSALIIFKLKFNLIENGLKNCKKLSLSQIIKKNINKPNISQIDIEREYNKIESIKTWYDLHITKLESNLKEIQNILKISIFEVDNNYFTIIYKNIKHLFGWLIPTAFSTTLDSFSSIIVHK